MKTRLKLFFKWGIRFENPYTIEEKSARKVHYADRGEVEAEIIKAYSLKSMQPYPMEFGDASENEAPGEFYSKKHSPRTRKANSI